MGEQRITQYGAYVEFEPVGQRISQFAAFVEIAPSGQRITQYGAYVEIEEITGSIFLCGAAVPESLIDRGIYHYEQAPELGKNGQGIPIFARYDRITWRFDRMDDSEYSYFVETVLGGLAAKACTDQTVLWNHDMLQTEYAGVIVYAPIYDRIEQNTFRGVTIRIERPTGATVTDPYTPTTPPAEATGATPAIRIAGILLPPALAERGRIDPIPPAETQTRADGLPQYHIESAHRFTWPYLTRAEWEYITLTILGGARYLISSADTVLFDRHKQIETYHHALIYRPTWQSFQNGLFRDVALEIQQLGHALESA